MVQVLPGVPSFGSQLAQILSQAGADIGQGLVKRGTRLGDLKISEKLNDPKTSYADKQTLWSQLSPEAREIQKPFLEADLRAVEAQKKEDIKLASEKKQRDEELVGLKQSIESLKKDIPHTGVVFLGEGLPGSEQFQKRQEFDSLGFLVADKVFTHFNKGTVSKEKLETIKNDLAPRSDLYQSQNIARINALEKVMGLPPDISEEKLDAIVKKEKAAIEKETESFKKKRPSLKSFVQ